jgi:hypothetical protein
MLFVANYFFCGLQLELVFYVRANIYLIHLFVFIYMFVTSLKKRFQCNGNELMRKKRQRV